MAELKLISAESVTEGHPDKVCDQISDAILDDMLAQDPHSHVAVETCATVGQFFVFGEVTSEGYSDIQNIVRSVVRNIGYTSSRVGRRFLRCDGVAYRAKSGNQPGRCPVEWRGGVEGVP